MINDDVKLSFKGLSIVKGSDEMMLMMLIDESQKRQLIVPCDWFVGRQIRLLVEKKNSVEKFQDTALEVLADMMQPALQNDYVLRIYRFDNAIYHTCLYNRQTGESKSVRCTDGVLLAIVGEFPIYASLDVMRLQSSPYDAKAVQVPLPLNLLSDKLVEDALQKAIEEEDYETASNLRDELKKRHHEF